jgi:hypothetical protein
MDSPVKNLCGSSKQNVVARAHSESTSQKDRTIRLMALHGPMCTLHGPRKRALACILCPWSYVSVPHREDGDWDPDEGSEETNRQPDLHRAAHTRELSETRTTKFDTCALDSNLYTNGQTTNIYNDQLLSFCLEAINEICCCGVLSMCNG